MTTEEVVFETRALDVDWYAGSKGYNSLFTGARVPLPKLPRNLWNDRVPLTGKRTYELKYRHFSVVMSKSRKLAFFTAVNIDGKQLQELRRERDVWYFDPRIDRDYQMGPEVYKHRDLDRGHLVRRLDPVWGADAKTANEDTFHFTNCSPQHSKLNQRTWLGLEDYILGSAKVHDLKVTVFTGPIFRDDDRVYLQKYQLPADFWKVVVVVKTDGMLSATAYAQSQRDLISDLEAFTFGEYKTYQLPVRKIEQLTGLEFGNLSQHDPLDSGLEARGPAGLTVSGPEDIVL